MALWWLRICLVVFIERELEYKIFRNEIVLFIGTVGKVLWNENAKMIWGFLRYITVENILWPLWTSNQWFPRISFRVWCYVCLSFLPCLWSGRLASASGASSSHLQGLPQAFTSRDPQCMRALQIPQFLSLCHLCSIQQWRLPSSRSKSKRKILKVG